MPQRGLLRIGGVVAAGAGLVGVPADFRAGRGLRVMLHQIVGVRVGVAVTALAHIAVGCSGAGRGGGLRVVCGFPVNHMLAAGIDGLCHVLVFGGFYIGGRGRANVVVGVEGADIDPTVNAVGLIHAGGFVEYPVLCGVSVEHIPAAFVPQLWRVLGLGDFFCIDGIGLTYMVVRVFFSVSTAA